MDNYMDKQTAVSLLDNLIGMVEDTQENDYDTALKMGIEALKAHAQPVQRGHWQEANTHTYGIYECDVCKGWTYIPNEPRDYKFCPRCGARMDGEKNE